MPNHDISYAEVMDQMSSFQLVYSRIYDFKVLPTIKQEWLDSADLYEKGREQDAVRDGLNAVNGMRGMFAKFLGNSPRHFESQIVKRDQDDFDEDIIAGLRSKLRKLEEAIRMETNGNFDQRTEAYIALKNAIKHADEEQKRLDDKRDREEAELLKAEQLAKEAATAEANRLVSEQQRQKAMADRKELADKARSLFE